MQFFREWDWRGGEAEFRKAVEIDRGSVDAVTHYAFCLHQLGRWEEAIAGIGEMNALQAAACAGGCRGYWQEMLRGLRKPGGEGVPPYTVSAVYARLGEKDAALGQLELAFRQHAPRMIWLRARSTWDPLRAEARFRELLRAMRFPD